MSVVKTGTALRIVRGFTQHAPFHLNEGTLLLLARRGSHTYGTNTPESDEDFTGVVVPPIDYKLGRRAVPVVAKTWEGEDFFDGDIDCDFYSLDKFVSLLMKCSPNALETLWLRPEDIVYAHPLWEAFVWDREAFSSIKAHTTFCGMASGRDQKSLIHPIRILRMLVEFHQTGNLNVYRQDAEELKRIKNAWTVEQVVAARQALLVEAQTLVSTSKLPEQPNLARIDHLLRSTYFKAYNLGT